MTSDSMQHEEDSEVEEAPAPQIKKLNAAQQQACELGMNVANSRQVGLVSGSAGTGKSFSTKSIIEAVGGSVTLLAPTNRAAQRVAKLSGHPASTFHAWMYKPLTDDHGDVSGFIRKNTLEINRPKSGLILVDEASMVSPDLWHDTLDIANALDCGIMLIGDYFQLPPVLPNGEEFSVFDSTFKQRVLEQGRLYDRVNLTEVWRQAADSPIIRAATELRNYPLDWRNAVSILENQPSRDNQEENGYNFTQPKNVARKICAMLDHGVDHCAIVFTNALRHEINRSVREFKGWKEGTDPQVGEPLLVRRNNKTAGVSNGEIIHFTGFVQKPLKGFPSSWRITKINGVECIISVDVLHGSEPPKYDDLKGLRMPFVECNFGYAMTAHAAQGSEFDATIVHWESALVRVMSNAMRIRWVYTSMTRSKQRLMIGGLR